MGDLIPCQVYLLLSTSMDVDAASLQPNTTRPQPLLLGAPCRRQQVHGRREQLYRGVSRQTSGHELL